MELLERIGSGAYGEVWLARNMATGARRAVKIVYRSTFSDQRPFDREFEGIKKFEAISHSHPAHLSVFQVGRNEEAGYFYYVMELADSVSASGPYVARTLRGDLEGGRLEASVALQIALSLTDALAHLHAHGLIHRDVKPSNIIFVNGRPKLADIGLVTDASDSRSIVGTEGYLPQEGPGTPAADLFALGKVLYEALTGFDRRKFPELPIGMREWPDATVAFEINAVLLKACSADVRHRYATAEGMLAELKLLQAGKSLKRRRSIKRGMAWTWRIAACIGLAAIAGLLFKNEQKRRAELIAAQRPEWEKAGTTNQAALQAYGRAIQMGLTYTTAGLSNAVLEYERAIKLDPNFAGAWSTLSITLTIAAIEGHLNGATVLPRAKYCAEKAIALRPQVGFPYGALAQCNIALDYDFPKAAGLFRKGIELSPENGPTRNNFAWELLHQGQLGEAEQMWKRVRGAEPHLASSYAGLGYIAFLRGHESDALALFDEALLLSPDRPIWRMWQGDVLWGVGRRQAAAEAWLRQVELGGFHYLDRLSDGAKLRHTLTESGHESFLRQLLALSEGRAKAGHFVSAFDLARLCSFLGDPMKALDYLEAAVHEHRGMILSVKASPIFKELRDEPRFHSVLRSLRLEK